MLRGTPDHPKIAALAQLLGIPAYGAVGLMEMLWHYTARYSPQGDLGKWPNASIARACKWDGDADVFVAALLEVRFLDPSREHRLVVHDWHAHADKAAREFLRKRGLQFVTQGARPIDSPEPSIYVVLEEDSGRIKIGHTEGSVSARIDDLQTGNPSPLVLLAAFAGTRRDESRLHKRFESARIAGEWFAPTPELEAWIATVTETGRARRIKNFQTKVGAHAATTDGRRRGAVAATGGPPPEPEPEPVPEPEPLPADDDERGRARATSTSPPSPFPTGTASALEPDPALAAATSRFARLVVQLEQLDPALAGTLEAEAEAKARTSAEFDAYSDRALERLTQPDPQPGEDPAPAEVLAR